ncbi:ABC transporter substrate-binding protein [Clostridium tagluense]|uniref:ABC transporter substrate-binding protein n=1 Tax=Clostridium tagluense TaxID=360422 RepID=UPI001CF10333|nr:ABC transporter substrate-binding protein [Clostridium tagluense]MCB2310890.1 ABC transporter substrate-binding protein [Clostridium tagluense]MCB2315744.1 ABC transporter substrate-binding protein [Clostridium tagluense]MCB2320612.1 ABC transporter substrate-binding protein [Clostridium tagluense]MCB2325483.1 ABC transporter substrate-binding protein [Clostridium tagluense]MCB2330336.1 ABC transporter substrate-binding protein [Clostridium tagluense]
MKKLMKSRLMIIAMAIIVFASLLTACTSGKKIGDGATGKLNEEKEIVLGAARDLAPGETDAYYASSILYVWEPLVGLGENGVPIPQLAEEWSNSKDYKEWTFKIKKGVKFQDGIDLNADAVIKNFERYTNMKTKGSPFYSFNVNKTYPNLESVQKVSGYEVKLIFSKPISTLTYNMARFGSAMYSPKCFDVNTGDFTTFAQGTGPFKIVDRKKDQFTLLERNENYYGEKAKVKNIKIKVIPDSQTRYSALKSEEIMGVMDLGAITPELATELVKDKNFETSTSPSTITQFISVNGLKSPFNNAKIKEALSLLIDRQTIVKEFYGGHGTPTINILNQTSPFAKEIKPVYDAKKAKEIIKKELNGQKMKLEFVIPSYGVDRYPYKAVAEYLQSVLSEVGLNSNITILDGAAFKEAQKTGNYNMALHTQGLPSAEPFTIFDGYMRSGGSSNKAYSLGYKNQRADELIEKLKGTMDLKERGKIYNELQDISAKNPSSIPLFEDVNLIAYNKKITGYKATIYGTTLSNMKWSN